MTRPDSTSLHANERALFRQGMAVLGVKLPPAQLEQLHRFYLFFKERNRALHLTSLTRSTEMIPELFVDSLALGPFLMKRRDLIRTVDIGTGAGFPGLPLKIACPRLDLTLLDTSKKKLGFCHLSAMRLGLEKITIREGRAEEAGHDPGLRESFDLVSVKAVAGLPTLLEYGMPLLRNGGILAAYKGADTSGEADTARNALELLHGRIISVHHYSLGGDRPRRSVVLVEKLGRIDDKYPRKPDLPRQEPL